MIFRYKSFFVNYILSFSLVGLWSNRLLVQMQRHSVQFTLAHRYYDNCDCHNKPQIVNATGVWMTSCPEAMGWEFGYFEKHVSWVSTVGKSSWEFTGDLVQLGLGCWPDELVVEWGPVQLSVEWRPVELGVDLDDVESWSWVKTMVLRSWGLDHGVLQIFTDRDLKHYGMHCAFVGSKQGFGCFVSIEWLRQILRIVCLSLLVLKNQTQKSRS